MYVYTIYMHGKWCIHALSHTIWSPVYNTHAHVLDEYINFIKQIFLQAAVFIVYNVLETLL